MAIRIQVCFITKNLSVCFSYCCFYLSGGSFFLVTLCINFLFLNAVYKATKARLRRAFVINHISSWITCTRTDSTTAIKSITSFNPQIRCALLLFASYMHQQSKTVIIISGPTASGKTALAIQLAQYFNTSIISADSRQCYKELNIGVARPSIEELHAAPHFFIASHSLNENVTAKTFEEYAIQKTNDLFQEKDTIIMAGGTGLYIHAFCYGLDEIPAIHQSIRSSIIEEYKKNGLLFLQQAIQKEDPLFWNIGAIQNPQRLMRALEVMRATGKSITTFQQKKSIDRPFNILQICIDIPVDILTQKIINRTAQMLSSGLVAEVKNLLPYRNLNALQTVGYKEIFEYIDGSTTVEQATEKIITHTKQYAKRQRTWCRREKQNHFIQFGDTMFQQVLQIVERNDK